MTRSNVEALLVEKCQQDPMFRQRLLFEDPIYSKIVFGRALEKGLGINLSDFLQQVDRVDVLQETPQLLYLVLPVCHEGCKVSPVIQASESSSSCPVCGMFRGKCSDSNPVINDSCPLQKSEHNSDLNLTRKEIESLLIIKAQQDPDFKKKLLSSGKLAIVEILKEWGVNVPEFLQKTREVKVLEETPHLVYLVLPVVNL